MHALYPNDASWIDSAGRLLIVAFFLIVGFRNLVPASVEDHVKRLTHFKTPLPRLVFRRRPPTLFDYTFDDIEIVGYQSHPALKAPVAV